MNHSHDANWFVKIMSEIINMIDSYMNHSYDAKWPVKIMSGIITMIFTVIRIMVMMLFGLLKSCLES